MVIKNLYGLVLVGGKSARMGTDKAALEYHGKKQSVYCYDLLCKFCEKVFISNRADQSEWEGQKGYPQIHDQDPFLNIGPLGGILTAMTQHPNIDWLILGCDLPYVTESVLDYLIAHRNPKKIATAFISTHDNLPEPLCAIYEAHSLEKALAHVQGGKTCPRKFLIHSDVELLTQPDKISLENINNPDEYKTAIHAIKQARR